MSYDEIMQAAENYVKTGEYYCLGFSTPDFVFDEADELWNHIANLTSNPFQIPEKEERSFFRCAC